MQKQTHVDRRSIDRMRFKTAVLQGTNDALSQDLEIKVSTDREKDAKGTLVNISQRGLCVTTNLSIKPKETISLAVIYNAKRYIFKGIVQWANSNATET